VGDLVWGLAHLESDGLSCDSTVGLRSTDVETNGNKPCRCSTGPMPERPLPHRPQARYRLGPTAAGGRVPGTRRRGFGVPGCLGGDRPRRPGSHSPMLAPPDRRLKPGPIVAPGSSIRRTRSSAATRSGRGAVCPRSHCDTDAWETPSASASPRWDRPHSSRARWSACPNRRRCSAVATLGPLFDASSGLQACLIR
jgi:hypothetical protein